MRIRDCCVIFDMDGVIFDTERFFLNCCIPAASKYGMKGIEEVYLRCIGRTEEDTRRILMEHYHDEDMLKQYQAESVRIFMERYEAAGGLPQKQGAQELLAWLKEQDVRMGLASSTRYVHVKRELEDAQLDRYFQVIIGGDMVKKGKPAPDIFLKAAEMLQADPQDCIVIEDSFNGIRAADRAGMMPLMVPDMLPPNEEIRRLAHRVFDSLEEVRKWMQENGEENTFGRIE